MMAQVRISGGDAYKQQWSATMQTITIIEVFRRGAVLLYLRRPLLYFVVAGACAQALACLPLNVRV